MGQAQINVRTRACSRTSIARTKQAALTHNVRGKELIPLPHQTSLSVATDCNRLQPIGMLGVSPNFGANGSNTSVTVKSVSVVT